MITFLNYTSAVKDIDFSKLPEAIQRTHNELMPLAQKGDYVDPDVKRVVDNYIAKLNSLVGSKKPASTTEPIRHAKTTPSSITKTEIKKAIAKIEAKHHVEAFPEEIKILKRFVGFQDRVKTSAQVMNLLDYLQKAMVEKKIRKTSEYASEILDVQRMLIQAYNKIVALEREKEKIQPIGIDSKMYKHLVEVVNNYSPIKSIALIKRYINLDGHKQTKEKAKRLLSDIDRYISKNPADPYKANLKEITKHLQLYSSGVATHLKVKEQALNGFLTNMAAKAITYGRKGIVAAKKAHAWAAPHIKKAAIKTAAATKAAYKVAKPHLKKAAEKTKEVTKKAAKRAGEKITEFEKKHSLSGAGDIFTPVGSALADPRPTFRLKGDIGKFLGDIEQSSDASITLEGDQGGGKTQFAFQLADAFATIDKKVGIFLTEVSKQGAPTQANIKKYITPGFIDTKILITDQTPKGVDTISDYANDFQVIIIDSWTGLRTENKFFDALRKAYPNTIFVALFQRTSGNKIRGGTGPLFDAGINIEVTKWDDAFVNNYAMATKNRYGETGIKYNISTRSITPGPEAGNKK